MKIILAPLRKDMLDLFQVEDFFTSIFYLPESFSIFDNIIPNLVYTRFEYSNTLPSDYSDDERDDSLLGYIFELKEHNANLMIITYEENFSRLQEVILREANSIEVVLINLPNDNVELNSGSMIYRETADDGEDWSYEIDELFPWLSELMQEAPIEGSTEALRIHRYNLN